MFFLRRCINQSVHYLRLYRPLYSNKLEHWDLDRSNQKDLVTAAEMIRLAENGSLFSTVP